MLKQNLMRFIVLKISVGLLLLMGSAAAAQG